MKAFQCGRCGQPLFFHNKACLGCGSAVAYDPTSRLLGALDAAGDDRWTLVVDAREPKPRFRFCEHREDAVECNWLVPDDDATRTACVACRLTRTIPDLSTERNRVRLQLIETAKRRVLYGLQACRLAVVPKDEDLATGLAFDLLEEFPGGWRVMTGHADGIITLNIAEADADYRERHRETLHEPYRTLIGHIRHEIGHYYWDRLIEGTDWLPKFRELFGDEQADYGSALQNHYDNGPPAGWTDRYISGYAAAHPWEDWAEIWAHYLHLRETLQTVESFSLDTSKTPFRITPFEKDALYDPEAPSADPFLGWINAWVKLTTVLNETARSMGQPDVYPFVLNKSSVAKMHFVQCVIEGHGGPAVEPPPAELFAVT